MDPVEAARIAAEQRRDPGKWGLDRDALALPANTDVVVEGDSRKNTARAQRYDVFALMFYRPNSRLSPASYDAVRRLQKDLAILHRTEGASDAIRTSGPGGGWVTERFSIARVQAGDRVEIALNGRPATKDTPAMPPMTPWCARLIRELAEHEIIYGSALNDEVIHVERRDGNIGRVPTPNWKAITRKHTGEIDRGRLGDRVREACADLAEAYRRIDNEPRRAVA